METIQLDQVADQVAVAMKQAVRGIRSKDSMMEEVTKLLIQFCDNCEFEESDTE